MSPRYSPSRRDLIKAAASAGALGIVVTTPQAGLPLTADAGFGATWSAVPTILQAAPIEWLTEPFAHLSFMRPTK